MLVFGVIISPHQITALQPYQCGFPLTGWDEDVHVHAGCSDQTTEVRQL